MKKVDLRRLNCYKMSKPSHFMKWYEKPVRAFHMDMYIPDFTPRAFERFDPVNIINYVERSKSNVLVAFAKNQWGWLYYNSKIGPKHPKLKVDFLAEVSREAKTRGVRILAYVNWLDPQAAKRHPEWIGQTKEGKKMVCGDWGPWDYPCPSSSYSDYLDELIHEIVSNYPVDGIWLDMFQYCPYYNKICYCGFCQAVYKERYNKAIPDRPEWESKNWIDFIRYRYSRTKEILRKFQATIKKANPKAILAQHYLGHPTAQGWLRGIDVYSCDYCDVVNAETLYMKDSDVQTNSAMCRFVRTAAKGKRVWDVIPFFHNGFGYTPLSEAETAVNAAEIIANGVSPSMYPQSYPDTTQNPKTIEIMADIYQRIERIEKYLEDARPIAEIGLYYSQNTRDFYGRDEFLRYQNTFQGFNKILTQEHFLQEVVMEHSDLGQFRLLILPNTACLSQKEIEKIDKYVSDGGRVLATYHTSLFTEDGFKEDNFKLKSMPVRYLKDRDKPSAYIQMEGDLAETIQIGPLVPYIGQAVLTKPHDGTERQGKIVDTLLREPFVLEMPPPGKLTSYPVVITGRYNKGLVTYVAVNLELAYWEKNLKTHKVILSRIVEQLIPRRFLELKAPTTVEVTAFEQPDKSRILIHLVNVTVGPIVQGINFKRFHEVLPVYDIEIKVRVTNPKKIYSVGGAKLVVKYGKNQILIKVARLEIHDIVVVEK